MWHLDLWQWYFYWDRSLTEFKHRLILWILICELFASSFTLFWGWSLRNTSLWSFAECSMISRFFQVSRNDRWCASKIRMYVVCLFLLINFSQHETRRIYSILAERDSNFGWIINEECAIHPVAIVFIFMRFLYLCRVDFRHSDSQAHSKTH